jgi:hypothetical protein
VQDDQVAKLEERLRLVEVSQVVTDARVHELENWRRRDEPRVNKLDRDATVADQVRAALAEQSAHVWSLPAKIAAAITFLVTATGGVLAILQQLGWLGHG